MTSLTEIPITNVVTLKIVHPNLFSERSMKTRIFIQQVDNKITDAIKTSNERQIRYVTSLFREIVTEWTTIYTDTNGISIFVIFKNFKNVFLKRFTNSNLVRTIMKKLLTIKQERLSIQEYVTKILNLTNKIKLKD